MTLPPPMAGLASALLDELDARDGDALLEGLHLDARLVDGADAGLDAELAWPAATIKGHIDAREPKGMAERDQLGRPLRGQDAGHTRDAEDVTFGRIAAADGTQ